MKLTALAVVILALGFFVGFALAGGSSGGPVSAIPKCPGPSSQCATPTPTPPPQPQTRQAEVTLIAAADASLLSTLTGYNNLFGAVTFTTTTYPDNATFTLSVGGRETVNTSHCFRLTEVVSPPAASQQFFPLADSEVCSPVAGNAFLELRSQPLTLPAGDHLYIAQWSQAAGSGAFTLGVVRILVEWTE